MEVCLKKNILSSQLLPRQNMSVVIIINRRELPVDWLDFYDGVVDLPEEMHVGSNKKDLLAGGTAIWVASWLFTFYTFTPCC
jgi:hypothetical protein